MDSKIIALIFVASCVVFDAVHAESTEPVPITEEPNTTSGDTEPVTATQEPDTTFGSTEPAPTAPPTYCPAGNRGTGGICDCTNANGWTEGQWKKPWCYEGQCYTGQAYDECIGKPNGYDLKDGTWCWNEERNTACPATPVDTTGDLEAKVAELEEKMARLEQCVAPLGCDEDQK